MPLEPGDTVRRKTFREASSRAKACDLSGSLEYWWGLKAEETGTVKEVIEDAVYIEGHGDLPHHVETLEKI